MIYNKKMIDNKNLNIKINFKINMIYIKELEFNY